MSKLDPPPLPPSRVPLSYLFAAAAIWTAVAATLALPPAAPAHYAALGCEAAR